MDYLTGNLHIIDTCKLCAPRTILRSMDIFLVIANPHAPTHLTYNISHLTYKLIITPLLFILCPLTGQHLHCFTQLYSKRIIKIININGFDGLHWPVWILSTFPPTGSAEKRKTN